MQKLFFVALFLLSGFVAAAQHQNQDNLVPYTSPQTVTGEPYAIRDGDQLTVKVLPNTDGTFYYEILVNGAVTFRQKDCPGKPTGTGFPTKSSAQKVADRVVLKIKNPVIPPIVTAGEMEHFGLQ